ncbi:excinuclease ABC subunit UvrA [Actinomyces provencensis]|uniref:excinuclease ABC subunit UvrA n=1 Tax=Actinomyces provencensis TaxID=1720198 RepID=UPI00096A8F3B|nr:excinuclease ABC subunit UvrA [Actinomyces provencensis]
MGPTAIEVRGARVNNLRDIDLDIPLGRFVGITGLSGSGKSSLAMGVLYAEGSRRYLDALSTFSRRRIAQPARPDVDRLGFLPPALALRQRPPLPGPRSTVGTMSEVLAVLRLVFSRLGMHRCPNGHPVPPSYLQGVSPQRTCPTCGAVFEAPSAEDFSFNTLGACPRCHGLGETREVDPSTLVPDEDLSIDEGAVLPWHGLMRSNMPQVAAELGVRTDIPYRELTAQERETVLHGPRVTRRIVIPLKNGSGVALNAAYTNAFEAVEQIAREGEDGAPSSRADRFLVRRTCPECHGTRLRPEALRTTVAGRNIAEACALTLEDLDTWVPTVVDSVPPVTREFARRLGTELARALAPLLTLGLGYLGLDRSGDTLSTGERQRIQLARTVLSRSTGLLLVLDEPTIGLHPANVHGLVDVMHHLVANGNSLVVVDHDTQVLAAADQLIEMGPRAGEQGGRVVAQGTVEELRHDPHSLIGPFLDPGRQRRVRDQRPVFLGEGAIRVCVGDHFNLHGVTATFPVGAMTAVTGVSGAGKSALVLDSLVPALQAASEGRPLPDHVQELHDGGIRRVISVDATPIGRNARSTPATYSGVFDPIRRLFAATPTARERGWKAGHFSYNTTSGRCPTCQGLGELSLDVQYLPDIPMRCPDCGGGRYNPETLEVHWQGRSIADVLGLSVTEATEVFAGEPSIARVLQSLADVGLGYLRLGEPTPTLSGGEAQRLRLATHLRRGQRHQIFVFDEPSIGLHPLDIHTLLGVFDRLMDAGATLIVIEHDTDMIANADHVIDLGPGAGSEGGRIISTGTVEEVRADPASLIGPWL